jgi:type III secretion protein R
MRWLLLALCVGTSLFAQTPETTDFAQEVAKAASGPLETGQIGIMPTLAVMLLLTLLPYAVLLLTSFTKISVVLSLLRTALGTQSAPPTQVITGLALLLSIYVMFPTGLAMYKAAENRINTNPPSALISDQSALYLYEVARDAREPLRDFLKANTGPRTIDAYYTTAQKVMPDEYKKEIQKDDFLVLMPAYITGQLKSAFEVGVLIYLPFFVIDLVVSNILLAMGMMMLSPLTIALPLKLLLLVMVDGWTLLLQGLVTSYHSVGG